MTGGRALKAAARTWHTQCFELIRREGFYEQGTYHIIHANTTNHKGDIQPAGQKDVERLPEGARSDGAITIFTDTFMRTSESPNSIADHVRYQGVEYEVSRGEFWPSGNEYLCAKVGQ